MEDFVWPADLAPYRVAYYLQGHVGGSESPLTRTQKTYVLGRQRWVARLTYRGGYEGGNWSGAAGFGPRLDALIAEITASMPRIGLWDFRRPRSLKPQLIVEGGLYHYDLEKGATSIAIGGFAPGSLAFSAGDYVGLEDGRAHIVTAPAVAGETGVATVSIQPPVEIALEPGVPTTTEVCSWFKLRVDTADDAGANETEVGGLSEYVLDFVEDL